MEGGFGESAGISSYASGNPNPGDVGEFECNICFELAEDPIVTLCGHLYCWPCLYRWLHSHSQSHECPVCKALIEEEKLVPIYGRGKSSLDPRRRSFPGDEIPHRPTGQRPETAPPRAPDGLMGGFMPMGGAARGGMPMGAARGGNLSLSASFGGLIPFLNFQVHGYNYANAYGAATGFPYFGPAGFHGGHAHGFHHHLNHRHHHRGSVSKMFFWFLGVVVVLYLLSS